MSMVLFDWGPSPFCLKVRAILDYKGIEYRRANALPRLFEVYRRGRIGKVPALTSTAASSSIRRISLTRSNACFRSRAWCPTLRGRRPCVMCSMTGRLKRFTSLACITNGSTLGVPMLSRAFAGPLGTFMLPFFKRRIRGQVRAQGTGRKPAPMVEADLKRALTAVQELIQNRPFLLGDEPTLCDFSLMAQLH